MTSNALMRFGRRAADTSKQIPRRLWLLQQSEVISQRWQTTWCKYAICVSFTWQPPSSHFVVHKTRSTTGLTDCVLIGSLLIQCQLASWTISRFVFVILVACSFRVVTSRWLYVVTQWLLAVTDPTIGRQPSVSLKHLLKFVFSFKSLRYVHKSNINLTFWLLPKPSLTK